MAKQFVTLDNLRRFANKLETIYLKKVDKASLTSDGVLSKEDYAKLASVASNATAVSIAQVTTSGDQLAKITINGVETPIYGSSITTDTAISSTSTNPVQNKVIKLALDTKADKATTLDGYGITDAYTKSDIDSKLGGLDVSDTAVAGKYVSSVKETDGKIIVSRELFPVASATSSGIISPTDFAKLASVPDGKTIASDEDVANAIKELDVTDTAVAGKYVSRVDEIDGKVVVYRESLPTVSQTYDATGTEAASGAAIADAIKTLDVSSVGGGLNQYISAISEVDGKINATVSTLSAATQTSAGLMSAADKIALDTISGGGGASQEYVDQKIESLDVADVPVVGRYVAAVSETNGKINVSRAAFPSASATQDGLLSKEDFSKLAVVGTGKTIATTDNLDAALKSLDAAEVGGTGKYISAVSETDGIVTATASSVEQTYNDTGVAPVSGSAIAAAIATLDVDEEGDSKSYIQKIKQVDGKITATKQTFYNYKAMATLPTTGDVNTLYYLTADQGTNLVGLYIYDGTGYVKVANVASAALTGGGNAVTKVEDANGAITATKEKTFIETSQIGTASTATVKGVAELDENGIIVASQLPASVSAIYEAASRSAFPTTGQAAVIYVSLDDNKCYRWGGTSYVEISQSLSLGETTNTAYRGDRGKVAYDHASATHQGATASGLYKISVTAEGHVGGAVAVTKADISSLGIAEDSAASATSAGLMSAADFNKLATILPTDTIAKTTDITDAIEALDVASAGGAGKYISEISETDGKISATVSDISSTYSSIGTAPVNGKAVAAAIAELDVASVGEAGKYISAISETDGKISATATSFTNATTAADGFMSKDDKAKIDGIAEGATVTAFTPSLATGTAIGTLSIDGVETVLYAPVGGGGGGSTTISVSTTGSGNAITAITGGTDSITVTKGSTFATSDEITNAINLLDVASVGGSGKYVSAISETNGKISATASDISSTYSATGTDPVDGKAVADALSTLDVAEVGGTGKFISAISEADGKISATASNISSTYSSSDTAPVNGVAVAAAIATLDVASVGGAGKYISEISETDGKISATVSDIASTYSATGTAPVNGVAVASAISSAINALDVASVGGAGKYISAISETDGKISAIETSFTNATTTDAGLMSADDKAKLDGMEVATVAEVEAYLGL